MYDKSFRVICNAVSFKKIGEIDLGKKTPKQDLEIKNDVKIINSKEDNNEKVLEKNESKIHTKYEKLSGLKKTGEKINLENKSGNNNRFFFLIYICNSSATIVLIRFKEFQKISGKNTTPLHLNIMLINILII